MAMKYILVTKQNVADEICDEIDANYMIQDFNGKEAYCFLNSDRLHKLLSNKQRFQKKDWSPYNGALNF